MKAARWGVLSLALWVMLAGFATSAWAALPHRVVLLASEGETNPVALELTARVRGELVASNLDVVVLSPAPAAELRTAVETAVTEPAPTAVIAVRYLPPVTPEQSAGADVWISDRLTHTTFMQVARVQGLDSEPAARLAVLVAEILRARLSLIWVQPAQKSAPVTAREQPSMPRPPPPKPVIEAEPRGTPIGLSLGGGAGFSHYFTASNANWYPTLQAGYEPAGDGWGRPWLRLSATWTPQESRVERALPSLPFNRFCRWAWVPSGSTCAARLKVSMKRRR
jgi:hypothetical protein